MQHVVIGPDAAPVSPAPEAKLKLLLRRSHVTLALLLVGFGAPLALVPISGAVIAGGEVSVTSRVKRIAHPSGGVIAAVAVRNGDRVRKGDLLMQLDTNVSAASALMTTQSVKQLLAREARLRAERDGAPKVRFPAALADHAAEPDVARVIEEEYRVFVLNRAALARQRATYDQQIGQAASAAGSYRVQADVYRQQEALIAEEREANDRLWEKRYTTLQRRNELIRAAVGIHGSVAASEASAAQMSGKIAELREAMLALDAKARSDAAAELTNVQTRLFELRQNDVVTKDTDARNTIRAPYAGVIDKLAFGTVGGVVPAGETILEIVPDRDPLMVTARVGPTDIDQLRMGQPVSLRFTAFNQRTTPQVSGRIREIGADRTVDPQHGIAYYPVEIEISNDELARLREMKLRSGMPVEAYIRTGDRSLLTFIFKPLADQMARAFR